MTTVAGAPLPFVKGHGTENDFILVPDPDGSVALTPGQIRALCDRRAGIGADGVIRVTRDEQGGLFMDYYNADASVAEMCGNGARVFARYLVDAGWESPGAFDFTTRGGPRRATLGPTGDVSIGMGAVAVTESSIARLGAAEWPGIAVDVGNPHLVCPVPDGLADLDLSSSPEFDHDLFPAGVNVEFVEQRSAGVVAMRVYERGSGETRSCGTGTVAVAATRLAESEVAAGRVSVLVPGGRVHVDLADGRPDARGYAFGASTLTGPAVLVARGVIDPEFLDAHR